jgi:hypothetical protein
MKNKKSTIIPLAPLIASGFAIAHGWSVSYLATGLEVDFGTPFCPEATEPKVSGYLKFNASFLKIGSAGCTFQFPSGNWSCTAGIVVDSGLISGSSATGVTVGGGIIVSGDFVIKN